MTFISILFTNTRLRTCCSCYSVVHFVLVASIRQVKLEMDQCKNELTGLEKEVVQLKRDGENKALQINQLDITLEEARSELNKKANEGNLAILFLRVPFYCSVCVRHFSFPSCFIIKYMRVKK